MLIIKIDEVSKTLTADALVVLAEKLNVNPLAAIVDQFFHKNGGDNVELAQAVSDVKSLKTMTAKQLVHLFLLHDVMRINHNITEVPVKILKEWIHIQLLPSSLQQADQPHSVSTATFSTSVFVTYIYYSFQAYYE